VQAVAWIVGMALLAWCISIAFTGDGWKQVMNASAGDVIGLIVCSLVSQIVNGIIFWISIRPVKRLKWSHMVLLNLTVSLLNYAPIRAGLLARVAYHIRIDRMRLIIILGWFGALGVTFILALAACGGAALIHQSIDWIWVLIVLGLTALGCIMTQAMLSHRFVERIGGGLEQTLTKTLPLWSSAFLRLFDIGAFIGRMWFAASILELDLSHTEITMLGLTAIAASLNPVGRTGFREVAVAFIASRFFAADTSGMDLDSELTRLALIESFGEALVAIPLGIVGLIWYRMRWVRITKARAAGDGEG
jgi:hypothetical protein